GSEEKVEIKGRHEQEFAWFAASGSVPGISQSAESAARIIVRATRHGEPLVVLYLGKLAALAHGVAPSLVTAAMGLVSRWLPESPTGVRAGAAPPPRLGKDSYNVWTERLLKPLVRQSGRRLNQL